LTVVKKTKPPTRRRRRAQPEPRRRAASDFSVEIQRVLAQRVNYRCSNPECRRQTSGPRTRPDRSISIGMAAHITAASPGGPRFDASLTPAQRRAAANGIWMCYSDGKLVDSDADRYTVPLLRGWKQDAEREALQALEAPVGQAAHAMLIHIHVPPSPGAPSARPQSRIVPESLRGSQLYRRVDGQYLFYVVQLWLENEPMGGPAIARSLTGTLSFLSNGTSLFPDVRAEWALANAADNVGFDGTAETLAELAPVGNRAKLLIVQKRTEDSIAYAWSKGASEYPGRRHPSHEIPPGVYDLRVRIRGIGIDEMFNFRLTNPGIGADPTIEGPMS
jgi:hypothetical protein